MYVQLQRAISVPVARALLPHAQAERAADWSLQHDCVSSMLWCGMPAAPKAALLGGWALLFSVFAARKWTQEVKDDIGDKSVFVFNALPDAAKVDALRTAEVRSAQMAGPPPNDAE